MEGVAVLVGLVLRLGVPLGLTALLGWWLKRLDARWQREAEAGQAAQRIAASTTPCWEVLGCPTEIAARYTTYFPALIEWLVGAGIVAYGLLAFTLGVRYLNIVDHRPAAQAEHAAAPALAPSPAGD
jgi:hypothetical protein